MSPTDPPTAGSTAATASRLCVFAVIASMAAWSINVGYPSGPPVGGLLMAAWIWAQVVAMVLPGGAIGVVIARRRPRIGSVVGAALMLTVPLLVLCDAITFHWIGERFLSASVWRLFTSLRESLTDHVSDGTVVFALLTATSFLLASAAAWWASTWMAHRFPLRPWPSLGILAASAGLLALPAIGRYRQTVQHMAACSARHPLCVIGVVGYRDVGKQPSGPVQPPGGGIVATMERRIAAREKRHLALTATATSKPPRDAVIVVIESFRPELIDPQVMPTLWDYASRGVYCQNHFSTGNATTHGMFGLFNGLEAVWYSRQMKDHPLLNRLLRSAGYEIGFFAGHNDWKKFRMDGFINRDQFDVFETDDPNWLESDRQATQRAVNFLQPRREAAARNPRLAILYLYSTHADYHSYPQDRIFQPAADDRFVIPYTSTAAPRVWNRYQNSAHSIDRFLAAILADDRVAIVTGDHGEAFLEDGVCGHGVRISRYQNMTPAVIYCPGETPARIIQPTMHADLLPTLMSALGLRLSDPEVLDGIDLLDRSHRQLQPRLFVTRNYLSDDCALIGPQLGATCFGYRCAISLTDFHAVPLNPIDQAGYRNDVAIDGELLLQQWLSERFPERAAP